MTIETDIRQAVEANCDYLLRRAYIAKLQRLLDILDKEAESIKHIELPLWYLENRGRDYKSFILIREDVDDENLAWAKSRCREDLKNDFCREETGVKNGGCVWRHEGPYIMIAIGNEVTPAKRYFMGQLDYEPESVRRGLMQRLGETSWSHRPKDIGDVLRRHFWSERPSRNS